MKRKDLLEQLVQRCPEMPSATVELMANKIFEEIIETIRDGGRVEIRGFGSFFSRHRIRRLLRNPRTGELEEISPKRVPRFKAGTVLKKKVDQRSVRTEK